MNASNERAEIYRFGDFEVDTLAHQLRRQGVRLRLQDQPYQILLLLLERAGQVVTRDELRQRIWPSSVFVDFDHGLNNAISRLREVFGDSAALPRFIETIPRVGYRFLHPVVVLPAEPGLARGTSPPATSAYLPLVVAVRSIGKRWLMIGTAVGAAVLAIVLLPLEPANREDRQSAAETRAGPESSIAVLPFASLSSDEENEHFSDGLTEELVTKLAGVRGLRIVGRTSSFRFKDDGATSAEIAQALQVSHLLGGSVRRSGNRLRISAQLVDARNGEHVWSETFDREAGDIFSIQEDIAFAVVAALKVSLLDADEFRIRRHRTSDPEAYRLYVIAQAHLLGRTKTPDWNLAKQLLEAAIKLDPTFSAAYSALARYYFRRVMSTLTDPEESERLGVAAAERAIVLDPDSSEARQAQANFRFWRYRARGDYESYLAAESDMQRAIELDPGNSLAFEDFGAGILWHQPDLALSFFEQAIKLDMLCTGPNVSIAMLLGTRGELDAARKRCADLRARVPDAIACDMALATLETYFGNFEQATALLEAVEKFIRGPARIQLWSVHMSMGNTEGALHWVNFGDSSMEKALSNGARLAMQGRYDQAFMVLERYREEFPLSHLLDLPAAKFALIAGKPRQALEILEQRLPDLVSGVEPISARNLIPALDLATALLITGAGDDARALAARIGTHLDAAAALRLPLFVFQRARAHALVGEADEALRALDRAYEAGLRTTWALDLRPQSMLYIDPIDADPAFDDLRDDPRYGQWFERIRTDNARRLERLGTRQAGTARD